MAEPSPPWTRQDALRAAAHALEGMAGAIHERARVRPTDLREAARLATALWPGAGSPAVERAFAEACAALEHWAKEAGAGGQQALGFVQGTAHRLALDLRQQAEQPGERDEAADAALRPQVLDLAERYGRYAPHFAP